MTQDSPLNRPERPRNSGIPRPDDPGPADEMVPFATLEMPTLRDNPLSVVVDVMEVLHHFDDDEAKLWEFLGKLHDMFRVS